LTKSLKWRNFATELQTTYNGGVSVKILIVDDDKQIRDICFRLLEIEGHQVVTTTDPFSLELLIEHDCSTPDAPCAKVDVDAILSDFDLGLERTGMAFLRELRQSTCRLSSVRMTMMSGGMPPHAQAFSLQHNVQLLDKPFTPEQLRTLFV